MDIATLVLWQLLAYSVESWLAFALIAFCAARCGGWWLVPVGHCLVAGMILVSDMQWIGTEMRRPGWDGTPDMGAVFYLGVLMRILLVNTVLLPITGIGLWRRRVTRSSPAAPTA